MDKAFWMQACSASLSRSALELQQANASSNGVAVSCALFTPLLRARFLGVTRPADSRSQVALFASAAVMSGVCCGLQRRLLLWRRCGREVVGDRIWKHLGTYSGWMCTGCAAGTVAFAVVLQGNYELYESRVPGISDRRKYELNASFGRHIYASYFFSPVELLCTIFAMNMLLRRVSDHASHR